MVRNRARGRRPAAGESRGGSFSSAGRCCSACCSGTDARGNFTCDDAFISFRYAQNWIEGGELVFNLQPLERVEGYTNFLWVILMGLGLALGVSPPVFAEALTLGASMAIVILASALLRSERASRGGADSWCLHDLLPGAFLVVWPEFVVWSSGGLETSFAVALGLGAWLAALRGRLHLGASLAAAAVLTRPDCGLWLGIAVTISLLRTRGGRGLTTRRAVTAFVLFALLLSAHLLWRRAYYGAWLPNTWAVKSAGSLLRDTWGLAYIRSWATNLSLVYLLPLVLFFRWRHVVWVSPLAGTIAYAWWVGGDFMAYSRFLLPATVCLALWVAVALGEWRPSFGVLRGRGAPVLAGVGSVLLLFLWAERIPQRIDDDRARNHLEGKWESVQAMDRFARVRLAAGAVMREKLPSDTLGERRCGGGDALRFRPANFR